uniref:Uncharacterized protein n=1 Tax=Arundo donax TaxID=35708 RepID=A0A0A8Y9S1_ARUDO
MFFYWWCRSPKRVDKHLRKGLNSLIILVAWELWKHRNGCVFNGDAPSISGVLRVVAEEGSLWCAAGAKDLHSLVSG